MNRTSPALDRSTPVLLVRVGRYPLAHGPLGAVRSLGRAGVQVRAMVEDRLTPTALSRYLTRAIVRPTSGREPTERLVATVADVGRRLARESGRRCVAVPTDDEAAVLLAEHAAELAPYFLLPPVPAALPRRLADKGALYTDCLRYGIPAPHSAAPADRDELLDAAERCGYPLVLKNLAPFTRLSHPVVSHATVVRDEAELLRHCPPDRPLSVLAQEYLPDAHTEHWITHLCCGPGGETLALFTGRKLRSYPPSGGFTTRAVAVSNPELAALAAGLCQQIGYSGIADLDWRLDLRDGRYKLLDFNPRAGAQFRLFETVDGVDVVRALHLSLTGRPVPRGPQLDRYYGVGQLDALSAAVALWRDRHPPTDLRPRRSTERAWLCRDDLVPVAAMSVRFTGQAIRRVAGAVPVRARGGSS
ncbi:carboxylate--amine ligase [Kitasatospora purpeofusca]|uniref:carboxylate--amine ligase n=1 Tax=Kitasatospora purpeofusca TaxID=67352 RepID=UPI0022567E1F|nr:ATP-grasp domain-containing protein [Kitasatospora purpeofusca]MCX4756620.1 ATP-grasp domain-containing protein [Kitasatospora purpeofusca]WSR35583.1 ATP-grasp domain-containing protein [Kitasatospora purpeofusca]WSR43901.1 ATP-grasp domain-containing protein [Kitasatospora purpeofusca]